MDFGLVLQTDPPARRVIELARRAEANGFTHVWVYDSPVLWQEPFVVLTRILAETDRISVGPMVTNPGTRDWSVLASTFATLNDMYGPRTICGMGRGDSALRYIGREPRTLKEMAEAMRVIKGLVGGELVDYHGKEIRFPWVDQGWELPMWGAGYGPRALDCIGRNADGFILQLADPQIFKWTTTVVRRAAVAAGRKAESVANCVAAPAYVGDDLEHQREQLRWFGGMVGNHVADIVNRYGEAIRGGSAGAHRLRQEARSIRLFPPRSGRQPLHRLCSRRHRRPLLRPRPRARPHRKAQDTKRPGRSPVRRLSHA